MRGRVLSSLVQYTVHAVSQYPTGHERAAGMLWSLSPEGTWEPPVIGRHGAWPSMTAWLELVPVPLSLRKLRWRRGPQATFGEAAREQTRRSFPPVGARPGQALAELWALKQPPSTGVLLRKLLAPAAGHASHLTPPWQAKRAGGE